jgi:hypothetical protein
MAFPRYLQVLAEQEQGTNPLSPQHVPSTFLFAFVGTRIVGRVSIRHSLNQFLEREGGHIGYVVVPEFRRQGYATTILRLAITDRARQVWCRSLSRDLRRRQCRVNQDHRKERRHPRECRQWVGPGQTKTPLLDRPEKRRWRHNIGLEPSRPVVCAMMSPWRARLKPSVSQPRNESDMLLNADCRTFLTARRSSRAGPQCIVGRSVIEGARYAACYDGRRL